MTITVSSQVLTTQFFAVSGQEVLPLDRMTLDLRTHKITQEQPPMTHPAPGEGGSHHGPATPG
jgi:hypothetical protein